MYFKHTLQTIAEFCVRVYHFCAEIEFVYAGWVKTPFLFACHKNSWRLDAWEKMAEALPKVDVVTFMNMLRPVKGESAAESQKRIGKLVESLEHKSLSDTERPSTFWGFCVKTFLYSWCCHFSVLFNAVSDAIQLLLVLLFSALVHAAR